MSYVWMSDALLSIVCFSVAMRLRKVPLSSARLAAIGILLLSIASMIGTLKYAFTLQGSWPLLHELTSRLFGVAGLYILTTAWLDFAGVLRVRQPWYVAHVADGVLIFLLAWWLKQLTNAQLVIGILMNIAALVAAYRCWRNGQTALARVISVAAVVFVVNGLVIGGAETPLFGPVLRIDLFHLLFTAWALGMGWVFRNEPPAPLFKQLP